MLLHKLLAIHQQASRQVQGYGHGFFQKDKVMDMAFFRNMNPNTGVERGTSGLGAAQTRLQLASAVLQLDLTRVCGQMEAAPQFRALNAHAVMLADAGVVKNAQGHRDRSS